jgi:ABC-type lipoprotein export system ATPase subunit
MDNRGSRIIEVKDLHKRYGDNHAAVIDGVNLTVCKGEMIVLTGRSGCGKTTLLNMIAGLDRPNSGKISIDGMEITCMTENELAKFRLLNVGFVFQEYNLIADFTILENVALPLKLAGVKNLDRAKKLLSVFDIAKLAEERANTVSGGEAQRAAIARAIANNPKVLLADEPTGNLDEENAINVMDYFKKIQSEFGMTIIVATHNKNLSSFGNRTIVFEEFANKSESS